MATDPVLRPMYPEDLAESKEHLALFLAQYWGGPPRYQEVRGHPRLRMRHAPYAVSQAMRDEWMLCMAQALTEQVADPVFRNRLIDTFSHMANHLINSEASHGCSV